jgi:uncharacterized protein YlxW (UPF0749 family)
VEGLRSTVDTLSASLDVQPPTLDPVLDVNSGIQAGMTPVTGAGLRVQLDDAPTNRPQPEEIVPDDLVVHQQDLEGVINALWAGGAEAMTLQGERVTALTAFRCVGNVLSLHGRVYSPPYVVEAVGDPDQLRAALDASGPLSIYREYVAAVGLGYDVQGQDQIDVPAFTGSLTLEHATVTCTGDRAPGRGPMAARAHVPSSLAALAAPDGRQVVRGAETATTGPPAGDPS